jgi:Zn-dependent protease with chaperone function
LKVPSYNYIHPEDRAALDNLKNIPIFNGCVKMFMKFLPEQLLRGMNMAQKICLGPEQLPEIYNILPPICKMLDIEEPEFYLEMNPAPNAYTYGDTKVFLTVTSGLIEYLEPDELSAVIAHECGHIACRHVLYKTMASMLINYGSKIFGPMAALSIPIQLALLRWERRSELSADRAAAVFAKGPDAVVQTMIRLAGGPKSITENVNMLEYIKQAEEYTKLQEESEWNLLLQGFAIMNQNHPFLAVRTKEIINWCDSEQFKRIIGGIEKAESVVSCPGCSHKIEQGWKFCHGCGRKIS